MPKEMYQRYHEEKARGGIGMTMIGGSTAIAEDTPGGAMLHLDASTDDIIPYYQTLAERVHKHGATVFAQIAHMGRRGNWDNQHWIPPIAPSRVREAAHRSFPKEMEDWDFKRVRDAFGVAAGRVKAGGIDGLELSASHGQLLDQFWSPKINKRTDAYGGDLRARARFTFEVMESIRRHVGDDFIVGIRMSGDELIDGGLTGEDCVELARLLVEEGGADYLSVMGGQAENLPSHAVVFPNMSVPSAPFLHLASAIKASVDVPVFHAQKVSDLATASRAIEGGHVDMVAMTRAHIADPHIVKKLMEGRPEDIRPCIGANYCIDRLYAGGQAYCLHNAATGRELGIPHIHKPAEKKKRAVIVGAGPGGLEAARILSSRGHDVTVFEKDSQSGGAVNIASKAGWRENLKNITRWLESQAVKQGVDFRYETEADENTILAENPDIMLVATGGTPAKGPFEGQDLAVTVWDILSGRAEPGKSVLLFDDNGGEGAASCAEFLAERADQVEFVTSDMHIAPLLERTTRPTFVRNLYDKGVMTSVDMRLIEIYKEGNSLIAVLQNEYTFEEEERAVDQVVVDYGTAPRDSLYHALKPKSANGGAWDYTALVAGKPQPFYDTDKPLLFRIGDAISSRNIHAAIYDAARLCKDL